MGYRRRTLRRKGESMTKRLATGLVTIALLVAGLTLAVPAIAGKSGGGGKLAATISMSDQAQGYSEFAVTRSGGKANDAYGLWVANKCYDANGTLLSAQYLPVQWSDQTLYPRSGVAGDFTTTGASCTSYVWEFPNSETPLGSASLTYKPY